MHVNTRYIQGCTSGGVYVPFIYTPGESYLRWQVFVILLLYLCCVFWALINCLVCWFWYVDLQTTLKSEASSKDRSHGRTLFGLLVVFQFMTLGTLACRHYSQKWTSQQRPSPFKRTLLGLLVVFLRKGFTVWHTVVFVLGFHACFLLLCAFCYFVKSIYSQVTVLLKVYLVSWLLCEKYLQSNDLVGMRDACAVILSP